MSQPLAERLRPKILSEYIGQKHLLGPQGSLPSVIKSGFLPSMILWGPPGVGKTTLAHLIAKESGRTFHVLSAVQSGVKDVREVLKKASDNNLFQTSTPILFIDEIHRFSKSQQDSLLNAVEKGQILLIGATTENPSFEVISALLSRCQVYVLKEHSKEDLNAILAHAIKNDVELKHKKISLIETDYLLQISGGDARRLLNALEYVVNSFSITDSINITNTLCKEILQENPNAYDKGGEIHYDVVSAFIKSIRGSDPNATLYWLARMIDGGEDVKFIARRMLIAASEDIGNANPTALIMANTCFQAVQNIGMPEGRIILSQCAVYLANSDKSNASYKAIDKALALVKQTRNLSVPLHLRNAPTKLMRELDYGKDYKYSHEFPNQFVQQDFLPQEIKNTLIYEPGNNPRENKWKEKLKVLWKNWYRY
ncbi:MAG: replication-associated recombination protein A [Flavobacteriales bacterium]